jgi:hypothetical protein
MKIEWVSYGVGIYETIKDFKEAHSSSTIVAIDGVGVVSLCEGCLEPIVEGQEYDVWEDGIVTHKCNCCGGGE